MRYENKGSNFRGRKRHAASGPRPREVSRFPTSFPSPPPPPHPFARSCNTLFARTKRRKMADFGPAPPKLGRVTRHKANLSLNSFPTFATVCSTTQLIHLFFSFISRLSFFLFSVFFFLEIHLILIPLKRKLFGWLRCILSIFEILLIKSLDFYSFLFFSFISRDDYLFSFFLEIRLILIRLKKENCSSDWDVFFEFLRFF